jgi:CRISPR/Cas system-associated exonuclease Cas4 (RecB family)
LKFLYPQESIKTSLVDYDIQSTRRDGIEVPKTKEIIEKLDKFRTEGSGKALSASAIKKYCHCPLQFYLEIVEELRIEEDVKEYMDDITYGNIVHAVAEKLYKRLDGIEITAQVLDNMKNDTAMLSKEIIMAVNEHYNKLGKNNDTELYGEAKVLAEIMLYSITELLEQEKQFAPIIFKSAEEKMVGRYRISPDLEINIKLFIDRVDTAMVNDSEQLRIVDYKTGSDKTSVVSFGPVFDSSNADNNGAILQMFIYCNFYAALQNYDASIQPIIYKLRTLKTEGLQPIKIGSGKKAIPVYDYREFNDEFLTYFHSTLEEIFNPEIPFAQTQNDDHCKYCSFKTICSK